MSIQIAVGQVTIGNSAAQIVAARPGRLSVRFRGLLNSGQAMYVGDSSGLTTSNGFSANSFGSAAVDETLQTEGPVYGIMSTAINRTISYIEIFDDGI